MDIVHINYRDAILYFGNILDFSEANIHRVKHRFRRSASAKFNTHKKIK